MTQETQGTSAVARLAEACALIAARLPEAQALIAEPDADGTAIRGQQESRPPWNPAAAAAWFDAWEGIRRLEQAIRHQVTGRHAARRADPAAALDDITKLAEAADEAAAIAAIADIGRWTRQIEELPAIDRAEPWRRLDGAACPYCHCRMLRVRPRSGEVTCLRVGACTDANGNHPQGRIEPGRLGPQVRWNDGLVAP